MIFIVSTEPHAVANTVADAISDSAAAADAETDCNQINRKSLSITSFPRQITSFSPPFLSFKQPLPTPAPTPAPTPSSLYSGDISTDFPSTGSAKHVIVADGQDVGMPPGFSGSSGWDIQNVHVYYDSDSLFFGLDFFGIASDADGDGDPSSSSTNLTNNGGVDSPNLQQSEGVLVVSVVNFIS